ncbi:MAG TPA: enoyl-CoA hydratase-related protein [Trueperaceae bacterium]|nr:enoyl-CoA hydratase-related protein [Trueperaceae bacterium]
MSDYQNLIVERLDGGVGLIRIHRPEKRNALNQATMEELARAATAFDADDGIGCIVLTGDERAFAAGADIAEMAGRQVGDMLGSYRFQQWEALRQVATPMLAAVSGYALGGGLELAMLCDMIVAADNAKLGQPEINLGIMPVAGGTQRLTKQLGKYLAMEVVLAGRLLTAQEAREHGLVNRVSSVEDALADAVELARKVASRAPLAAKVAKSAVLRAQDAPLEQGLAFERHSFYMLFGTEDQKEGVEAFLDKREPRWKGR